MELWLGMTAAYGALVAAVLGIGRAASELLTEDAKRDLGQWLGASVNRSPKDWVQDTNRAFVRGFDRLYGGQLTSDIAEATDFRNLYRSSQPYALRVHFWLGMFAGVALITTARVGYFGTGASPPSNGNLLLAALAVGITFSSYGLLLLPSPNWVFQRRRNLGLVTVGVTAIVVKWVLAVALWLGPFAAAAYFSVLGREEHIQIWRIAATSSAVLVIGVAALLLFGIVSPVITSRIRWTSPTDLVSPPRVILASLFFLVVVGFIRQDAARSFFDAIGTEGLAVFGFVAFNVFADVFSLLETRWVLNRSANAGVFGLGGWLLLDLLVSAVIFLFIPLVLWETSIFGEALLLRGDNAWLGILFWTTFSTSVMFYLFVLSALVIRPLAWLLQAGRHFDVENKPVGSLTLAAVVVITIAFSAGGVATGLYRVVA